MGISNLNRSSSSEGASLAFNILPGLIGSYFLSRKMPFADFLNGLLRGPTFADDRDFLNSIIVVARAHAAALIALRGRTGSGSRRPVPAATKLIRRTERLVRERRTGTAMQSAKQLQDLIDRDLILEGTVTPSPPHIPWKLFGPLSHLSARLPLIVTLSPPPNSPRSLSPLPSPSPPRT